jgi:hypothetical protein
MGGGAVAFEIEGEADRVTSVDPKDLPERGWPPEMVENYLQYRKRMMHFDASTSPIVGTENPSSSDEAK